MEFFTTSTTNLLAAAVKAGVRHYVALSVVGADRMPDSGYLRAKVAQEELIDNSSIPYTIVRATQFYEFVKRIADAATTGDVVRVPDVLFQPLRRTTWRRHCARSGAGRLHRRDRWSGAGQIRRVHPRRPDGGG